MSRAEVGESVGPGQVLFAFVRHWSRRGNDPEDEVPAQRGRQVAVVEVARSLAYVEPPSVNEIAAELGLDQSGASRMIKEAVAAGYLELDRSAADARRRVITVTAAGAALLVDAHRWQEQVFGELTEGWTARQRDELHRGMLRLLGRSRELNQ